MKVYLDYGPRHLTRHHETYLTRFNFPDFLDDS